MTDKLTLLLVEDDDGLRTIATEILKTVHDVIEVNNGARAIEEIEKETNHFDFLVTDFNMPHKNGAAVVRAFLNRFPLAQAIMMSGNISSGQYADPQLVSILKEFPSLSFIAKPFDHGALLDIIQDLVTKTGEGEGE